MSDITYEIPRYPAIRFIVAYGKPLSILVGLLTAMAGLYLTATGLGTLPLLVGIVAGVLLAGVLLSYTEVLRVISETLISR